jgi:hypothetical protein
VLLALGFGLIGVAVALGGRPAGLGGGVAVVAQLWAVALLRPGMRAPSPQFMTRWLGGMAVRFLSLAALIVWSVTHRAELPLLQAGGGFLGVLLPLLFLETRFLK